MVYQRKQGSCIHVSSSNIIYASCVLSPRRIRRLILICRLTWHNWNDFARESAYFLSSGCPFTSFLSGSDKWQARSYCLPFRHAQTKIRICESGSLLFSVRRLGDNYAPRDFLNLIVELKLLSTKGREVVVISPEQEVAVKIDHFW